VSAVNSRISSGRMMLSIFGTSAEFGRNLVRKQFIASQNRAKAKRMKMGRPSKMNDVLNSAIQFLR
jgi:DNA invertase Pin-like site-specific DNA recombinase